VLAFAFPLLGNQLLGVGAELAAAALGLSLSLSLSEASFLELFGIGLSV
jgi:hypothetical protein